MADAPRRTFSMGRLSRAPSISSTMRGFMTQSTSALPFASYPVMLPVRSKAIVPTFFAAALLIYVALTIFNVFTQGFDPVLIPVMQSTFSSGGGTSCQPVQFGVGDTMYSAEAGNFNWAITGVAANETTADIESSFAYKGGEMQCNITSVGVTYYFAQVTYVYGVCANCSVPTTSAISWDTSSANPTDLETTATSNSIVTMCSNFDLSISQPAAWAYWGQHDLENKIYSFGPYYQNLTFPNGTFSIYSWPPYGAGAPPANTAVTPEQAQDVSVWMAGIRYTPDLIDDLGYLGNDTLNGAAHVVVVNATDDVGTIDDAYNYTATVNYLSGTTLAFNGLGGLAVGGVKPAGTAEPDTITRLRTQGMTVMNFVMDRALEDIHQREIIGSYLCTITKKRWKPFWSMLAMILGNNAALFSLFLFAAPKIARVWDQRRFGETVLPFIDEHRAGANRSSTAGARNRDTVVSTVVSSPRESLDTPNEKGADGGAEAASVPYASYNNSIAPSHGRARPQPPRADTMASEASTAIGGPGAASPPLHNDTRSLASSAGAPRPIFRQDSMSGDRFPMTPSTAAVASPSQALMYDSPVSANPSSRGGPPGGGRGMWGPRPVS